MSILTALICAAVLLCGLVVVSAFMLSSRISQAEEAREGMECNDDLSQMRFDDGAQGRLRQRAIPAHKLEMRRLRALGAGDQAEKRRANGAG